MGSPDLSDQQALATWAADRAAQVLGFFEDQRPGDQRPRRAIEAARAWVRGEASVNDAREAAFAAHAAAREVGGDATAGVGDGAGSSSPGVAAARAARAAGHAAATAHVPAHAAHAAVYAASVLAGGRVGVAREVDEDTWFVPAGIAVDHQVHLVHRAAPTGWVVHTGSDLEWSATRETLDDALAALVVVADEPGGG